MKSVGVKVHRLETLKSILDDPSGNQHSHKPWQDLLSAFKIHIPAKNSVLGGVASNNVRIQEMKLGQMGLNLPCHRSILSRGFLQTSRSRPNEANRDLRHELRVVVFFWGGGGICKGICDQGNLRQSVMRGIGKD
jgi:hypothetical protein